MNMTTDDQIMIHMDHVIKGRIEPAMIFISGDKKENRIGIGIQVDHSVRYRDDIQLKIRDGHILTILVKPPGCQPRRFTMDMISGKSLFTSCVIEQKNERKS